MVVRAIVLASLAAMILALLAFAYDSITIREVRKANEFSDVSTGPNQRTAPLRAQPIEDHLNHARFERPQVSEGRSGTPRFAACGRRPKTCVVDGDTFWLDGVKIRLADIDTPEVRTPQCASERSLGIKATERLIDLLNMGPFNLQATGNSEYDRYGRLLRVVIRDGKSLGAQLVDEGLAHVWIGHKQSWCHE
jgi:micrococcal nuclease